MTKKNKTEYVCGDKGEGGFTMNKIIGFTPHFIVYLTESNDLRFEIDDEHMPGFLSSCMPKYDNLQTMINSSIYGKATRASLKKSLGRALYSAVRSDTYKKASACFDGIAKRIENEISLHARALYVSSSILAAIVIWVLCLLYFHNFYVGDFSNYILGGCTGIGGAVLSVFIRSSSIEIPNFSTPTEHLFQGLSRVFLGCLCGTAIVVLIKAELALGLAKDSAESIAAFGILAGFSERYLPNILHRMDRESETEETAEDEIEKPAR